MTPVEAMLLANAKPRGRQPVYKVNEFAFNEPLSPLAMYFLGILYTDGCIWREANASYRIQLGLIDYDVIDKFVEFLKYTGIAYIEKKKKNPRKIVQITSEVLGQSLINLGVTPVKTHTIEASSILCESIDFWRGVIDGDGSLSLNGKVGSNKKLSVSLRTASEKFADQYIAFAAKYSIRVGKAYDTCYQLKIYSENARKLLDILYKDCCFSMARKLTLYTEHSKIV